MRTQLRIVAGNLRGRKVECTVASWLRPTPQRAREALFSILGDAVPGRPFFDVFAGTGVVGLEALSRGASHVTFIERDFRLATDIERHLRGFGLADRARVLRADAYRWAEHWAAPTEPVTLFLSPPFPDYEQKSEAMLQLVADLIGRMASGSVLALQAEKCDFLGMLPEREFWDERIYGRNHLLFWVRETAVTEAAGGTEEAVAELDHDRA